MPGVSTSKVLTLDLGVESTDELPAIWLISHFLPSIWSSRSEKKRIRLFTIRADLEARASLLRESRFKSERTKIVELIQSCFSNV